ncbi:hypothetical protein GZH53_06720 [Flavihumibacter sp. R14]|nr:hypothetical protein [Flavihumibacter soli]
MNTRNLLIIIILHLPAFSFSQDLKKAWKNALKSCSKNEIFAKDALFFGPSNSIGIGSVWRRTDNGGYNPRFELADMVPDSVHSKIIKPGIKMEQCSSTKNIAWTSSISLPIVAQFFKVDEVSASLRRARRATISLDNLALDVIKELPFEQALKSVLQRDSTNIFVKDLLNNRDRLLITKAYRLTGLVVTLDYDPAVLEELKTKYSNGATVQLGGDKGLKIEFSYTSNSQLTIKLPKEVYIAGEFSTVSGQGSIQLNNTEKFRVRLTTVKVEEDPVVGLIELVQ